MHTEESNINSAQFCVFPQNIVPFKAASVLKHNAGVERPDCFTGLEGVINIYLEMKKTIPVKIVYVQKYEMRASGGIRVFRISVHSYGNILKPQL